MLISIKYDEERYLSQFASDMFDFLAVGIYKMCGLNKSLTILLQWKHTGFQTPQRLWRSISIFADGTSYARSRKQINMVA